MKRSYVIISRSIQQGELGVRTVMLIILLCISTALLAKLSGSLSEEAIAERLKPIGDVTIDGSSPEESTKATAWGPKVIYKKNCQMCHRTGLSGAPKFGNKKEWAPRIATGMDTMLNLAWNGFKAMPPKGNCLKCTKEDLKATIQFMVDAVK